jgi:hypothetical protein
MWNKLDGIAGIGAYGFDLGWPRILPALVDARDGGPCSSVCLARASALKFGNAGETAKLIYMSHWLSVPGIHVGAAGAARIAHA